MSPTLVKFLFVVLFSTGSQCDALELENWKSYDTRFHFPVKEVVIKNGAATLDGSRTIPHRTATIRIILGFTSGKQDTISGEFWHHGDPHFTFHYPNSPLTMDINWDHLHKIIKRPDGLFRVIPKNGSEFIGRMVQWVPSIYAQPSPRDSIYSRMEIEVLSTVLENAPRKFPLRKLQFLEMSYAESETLRYFRIGVDRVAMTVVLRDGKTYATKNGDMKDYCGHWWLTSTHHNFGYRLE